MSDELETGNGPCIRYDASPAQRPRPHRPPNARHRAWQRESLLPDALATPPLDEPVANKPADLSVRTHNPARRDH